MTQRELADGREWYRFARRVIAYSHQEAATDASRRTAQQGAQGRLGHAQTG
jgi:hypothetical protein